MKNIVFALGLLLSSLIFVGCENTVVDSTIPQLNSKFENEARVSFQDNDYECKILHTPEGLTTITFVSPPSLKDFTISRNCGKYEITQGKLEGEYIKDPLPKDSPLKHFIDVLDVLNNSERPFKLKKEEEGEKIYSGSLEGKDCDIILGKKGDIIRVSMQNPKLEVQFKGQLIN